MPDSSDSYTGLTRAERASAARMRERQEEERRERERREEGERIKAERRAALAGATVGEGDSAVRSRLPSLVLSRVHEAMADLADVPPKDRASILSLGARLSGLLSAQEHEDPPAFVFRGWDGAAPVAMPGSCPSCGHPPDGGPDSKVADGK